MFLKLTTFAAQMDLSPDMYPILIDVNSIEAIYVSSVMTRMASDPEPTGKYEPKVMIRTKSGDGHAVMESFDEVEKALKKATVFA